MQTIEWKNGSIELSTPVVMGILNITPDSFYDGGSYKNLDEILSRAGKMIGEGAAILDVGAVSTRPGAEEVSEAGEWARLKPVLENLIKTFPKQCISVDTYRSRIAEKAVDAGAAMVNDISGGTFDDQMFDAVARLQVPYIMMHIQGTPQTMQIAPEYNDVVQEVYEFFERQLQLLRAKEMKSTVIIDPGFGFGKTVDHNYALLKHLALFKKLDCPVMAGLSRKSMINKVLGTKPASALNGTTVVNAIALMNGADILRVHDVKEAVEVVQIVKKLKS